MIKAECNMYEASAEMKGNLADAMMETVVLTMSLLEAIERVDVNAALDLRDGLISTLAEYKPGDGLDHVEIIEEGVQQ